MEPDDLLRILQGLLDDHLEIWQCWSTTIQQLLICGRLEEAHELAKEGVTRFPLQARLWVDLAEVRRAQNETEGQIEALAASRRRGAGLEFRRSRTGGSPGRQPAERRCPRRAGAGGRRGRRSIRSITAIWRTTSGIPATATMRSNACALR